MVRSRGERIDMGGGEKGGTRARLRKPTHSRAQNEQETPSVDTDFTPPQQQAPSVPPSQCRRPIAHAHAAVPDHPPLLLTRDNQRAGAIRPKPAVISNERRSSMHGQGVAASNIHPLAPQHPGSTRFVLDNVRGAELV